MEKKLVNDKVLDKVDGSRRGFLMNVLKGSAFAAPLIASFSMNGLKAGNPHWLCASGPPTNQVFDNVAEQCQSPYIGGGEPGSPQFVQCVQKYTGCDDPHYVVLTDPE